MNGLWQSQTTPPERYLYNGKELENGLGLGWLFYGARMHDPAVGRFTGVDPIADQFAWVSPFNYAENEPVSAVDLWGLQKKVVVQTFGRNNDGELVMFSHDSYERTLSSTVLPYQMYAELPLPMGGPPARNVVKTPVQTGTLHVAFFMPGAIEGIEEGLLVKAYYPDPPSQREGSKEVKGGIQFTLSIGQGKETRFSENADLGPNLDLLLAIFGTAKGAGAKSPSTSTIDALRYFVNAVKTGSALNNNLHGDQDSIYNCRTCYYQYVPDGEGGFREYNPETDGDLPVAKDSVTITYSGHKLPKDTIKN